MPSPSPLIWLRPGSFAGPEYFEWGPCRVAPGLCAVGAVERFPYLGVYSESSASFVAAFRGRVLRACCPRLRGRPVGLCACAAEGAAIGEAGDMLLSWGSDPARTEAVLERLPLLTQVFPGGVALPFGC